MTVSIADERLRKTNKLVLMLRRPEIGALAATVVVFVFFSSVASSFLSVAGVSVWLHSASTYGIMAVAIGLLMIGGEFDLSAGVMTGTTGLIVGIMTTQYHVNVWIAVIVSLAIALAVGAFNGFVVMKTKLPSFIVTLGTFFILQGINLAVTKIITGQVYITGMRDTSGYESAARYFGTSFNLGSFTFYPSMFWWVAILAVATWVLLRTKFGNWTFAVGGNINSARQVGVPVFGTKIGLFMTTAGAAWLAGMVSLFETSSAQATTGVGNEFIYIICAVVGGCLLTGGIGSAVGASLGALIYGMTLQGIVFAQWDNNWLKAFLGVMLLLAVLVNLYVRKQAGGGEEQ